MPAPLRVLTAAPRSRAWLAFAVLAAGPVAAAAKTKDWHASGTVTLVSDYRFRGVSLSDRRPAIQGGLDLEDDAGFTAGLWASPVADTGGGRVEVDIYGGYKTRIRGFDLSVGAYSYLYPGGTAVDYLEVQATAQRDFGPVRAGLVAAYTPRQRNVTGRDNVYVQASLALPLAGPVSVRTALGYEEGIVAPKWDWEATLRVERSRLTASVGVAGSHAQSGGPAIADAQTAILASLSLGI